MLMETEVFPETGSVLCVLDESGDSRFMWDKDDPAQIAKAQAKFNEMKGKGYVAYRVNKKGGMGEVIAAFDPNDERVIMHRALVGG